jgi:hypothetical protein
MAPLRFCKETASILVNGEPKDYVEADVLGGQYAMFTVDVGPEKLLVTLKYDE